MKHKCISIKPSTQLIMLLSAWLLMACQQDKHPTAEEEPCMQLTAEQAGTQIVSIYREAIQQTTELVENQADAEIIQAQFDDLLHRWQTELLTIGQHVMVMTQAEKQQVQSAINNEHMNMQFNEQAKQQFSAYSQGIFPFHRIHPDLYQKLKSINIITQFAFFDLLKKQNPDAEQQWGEMMKPFKCQ